MDIDSQPDMGSQVTKKNMSLDGTFTDSSKWIDKLQKRDEGLLHEEVRKIFSSTSIDVEIARKINSVDIGMKKKFNNNLEAFKKFNERKATVLNGTNCDKSNDDGRKNKSNDLLTSQRNNFFSASNGNEEQTHFVSSDGDGPDKRSNFVNSDGDGNEERTNFVSSDGDGTEERSKFVNSDGDGTEERSNFATFDGDGTEEQNNFVNSDGDSTKERTNFLSSVGDGTEERSNLKRSGGDGIEERNNFVTFDGDNTKGRSNFVASDGDNTEGRSNFVTSNGDNTEGRSNFVTSDGDNTEGRSNFVTSDGDNSEGRSNFVASDGDNTEGRSNFVTSDGDNTEGRSNFLTSDGDNTEGRSNFVASDGNNTERRSNFVTSNGDNTEGRSNFATSDAVPVIVIDLSNSPQNVEERIQQTMEQLKVDSATPSTSRSSTPILVRRSRSFKEIKNYFEAKMHEKDKKETLLDKQGKKIAEKTTSGTSTQLMSQKDSIDDDSIKTNDSSSEDGWRESEDTEAEDNDSSSFLDESSNEDESDAETVSVSEHIQRLMQEDLSSSDASSDQSCSSDAILKRTTAKVLKKVKQKYKLARRSSSESEDSSSEETESEDNNAIFGQNERTRVRENNYSNVISSDKNEENSEGDFSSSASSSSDSSDEDSTESNQSSSEDGLDFMSNFVLKERTLSEEKINPNLEISGNAENQNLQNGHDSFTETDESVIYQSYNLEEQSGKTVGYHEEIGQSVQKKASSLKGTRSSSLPNFVNKNKLIKQVSFEEDPEVIPVQDGPLPEQNGPLPEQNGPLPEQDSPPPEQDDPLPEIPTTLEERHVSDLRWPFTNFYVKEVQKDSEDSNRAKLRSEVFPCYKSKKVSSSFPGRKKDVMLGRVWWVEWWAENECTEENEPELKSASMRNTETS